MVYFLRYLCLAGSQSPVLFFGHFSVEDGPESFNVCPDEALILASCTRNQKCGGSSLVKALSYRCSACPRLPISMITSALILKSSFSIKFCESLVESRSM